MPKREPKPKGRPKKPPRQMTVVSIKMTVEFRDWLEGFADSQRDTTVKMIEKAIVEAAERKKYPHVAPKRTEGR